MKIAFAAAALVMAMAAAPVVAQQVKSFYDLKTTTLDGKPADLGQYRGRVSLVVNVASQCGYTPQYAGLEKLHREMKGKGFNVLGFPSNDFGGQEPGSAKQIKEFCELTYGVKFPLVEKTSVAPGKANLVFAQLTKMTGEAPEWNFHKYLIARDGSRAFSFAARTQPESSLLVARIEELLAE